MSKRAGRRSQQQNDFLQPSVPTSVTATDVGTNRAYGNGAIDVSWTLPAGSPAATSYTVYWNSGAASTTTSSTSVQVANLASGTSYTFTVTATNAQGTSAASTGATATATTVPQAPVSPTASSSTANQDTVTWTTPANGGKAISSYTVTSSDGPSYFGVGSPLTVTETGGTSQYYLIYAINANGTSTAAQTNTITTVSPYFPPYFPYFPSFPYFPYFPYFPPSFPYFPGFGGGGGTLVIT